MKQLYLLLCSFLNLFWSNKWVINLIPEEKKETGSKKILKSDNKQKTKELINSLKMSTMIKYFATG